jgi:hypothetical protein
VHHLLENLVRNKGNCEIQEKIGFKQSIKKKKDLEQNCTSNKTAREYISYEHLSREATDECCCRYHPYIWNSTPGNTNRGGCQNKMFMDNCFLSPQQFSDIYNGEINSCGTIHNRKGMSKNFRPKNCKLHAR